jgi:hypothetical protein
VSKRVIWAIAVIVALLLIVAPLASYCLGREEDYRDKGELSAPRPAQNASAVVTDALVR